MLSQLQYELKDYSVKIVPFIYGPNNYQKFRSACLYSYTKSLPFGKNPYYLKRSKPLNRMAKSVPFSRYNATALSDL